MALRFDPSAYQGAWLEGRRAELASRPDPNEIARFLLQGAAVMGNQGRKEQAANLGLKLAEKTNLSPEQIQDVTQTFLRTGELRIPGQAAIEPSFSVSGGQPSRTYEPVQFGKEEALFYQESQGSPYVMQKIPRGIKPIVKGYGGAADGLVDVVVPDLDSGRVVNLGKVKKGSKVLPTPKPDKPAGEKETPEERTRRVLFEDRMKKYNYLVAGGEDVPEDLLAQLQEEAPLYGYDVVTEQGERRLLGMIPGKSRTKFVRQGETQGKQLTPELAKKFLQDAKGNKDLARKLAQQAGYTF